MVPAEIFRKVRQIEISTRRLVNDTLAGEYQSVFKGQGMEFREVRQYSPGDEVRSIDWNVTARMSEPYVRRYHEERELSVMLVVDASGSADFGSVRQFKRELAAELAAVLSFAATTNNDRVGLLIFTDRIELLIPPRKGRRHVLRLIRDMLVFEPQGRGTDIKLALDTVNLVLRRHSVVFLVSDFLADPEQYRQALAVTNRRHDVVAMDLHVVTAVRDGEGLPSRTAVTTWWRWTCTIRWSATSRTWGCWCWRMRRPAPFARSTRAAAGGATSSRRASDDSRPTGAMPSRAPRWTGWQ